MNIAGSAAIVTGGASGLGAGCVKALSENGAKICIFDLNEERGHATAKESGAVFCKVDVTDEKSVSDGLDYAASQHGDTRILINCAGIAFGQKTTSKGRPHQLSEFEKVIKINLIGTFNCIRLTATRMAELDPVDDNERGVIVNTASVAAFDGQIGQAAYSASKGGIVGMTLPIARDLARDGIRVVTVAPGIFSTPLMDGLPEKVQESLAAAIPFPSRLGTPADFAALVRHICENVYLNAETIRLDGAIRMAPR